VLVALAIGYHEWSKDRGGSKVAGKPGAQGSSRDESGHDPAVIRVQVVRPRKGGIARTTTQPGVVHAYDFVRMFAKVSGFLRAQVVDIGDTVERGQVIAEVYAPELQQAVEQAAAAVEEAKSRITQAEAMVKVTEAEVRAAEADVRESQARVAQSTSARKYRQKQYVRYNELAVSRAVDERAADEKQEDYESARAGEDVAIAAVATAQGRLARAVAEVDKARADVKAAQAALRVAEARQSAAEINVEYTRLVAPFNGVITERNFHDGDFIRSADSGAQIPPVVTVSRTDLMRVVVYVPDRDVPLVDRGDEAVVQIDALRGEEFKGRVSRFSNLELSANRAMRVEVDLPNPVGRLREGMYGNVTLLLEPPPDVLCVPSSALVSTSGHGAGVVFVAHDGRAHRTPVRVGRDDGRVVEILSGLSPDDAVIVTYSGSIEDGSRVEAPSSENENDPRSQE